MMADTMKRFTFRISSDLFDQVEKIAKKNHRSVNSEIILAVEKYVKTCSNDDILQPTPKNEL